MLLYFHKTACCLVHRWHGFHHISVQSVYQGVHFPLCEYNTDYLREKQMMMIESRLAELIMGAKSAGLSCEEFVEMAETLYKSEV